MKAELHYVNGILTIEFKKIKRTPTFDTNELNTIEWFIRKYHKQIVEKWTSFFVYGKKPTFEKVKRTK